MAVPRVREDTAVFGARKLETLEDAFAQMEDIALRCMGMLGKTLQIKEHLSGSEPTCDRDKKVATPTPSDLLSRLFAVQANILNILESADYNATQIMTAIGM